MNKIEVIRTFNAPVSLVWKTWTEPELVMRWWGPDHFTCPSAIIDFREGATSIVCMRAPQSFGGADTFSIWTYQKIVPNQIIEFIQNLSDKDGNKINPTEIGMPPDFPLDIRTVVTFKDIGDNQTEMTVTEYADFGSISNFAKLGLEQSIAKMDVIFK
ncbi:MAG TPA: SRPBCC domain-containing protein [Mucilaginibacter sp.]|nr:SRPBCC domain-containing protein [Mucilaginibacter sp.]